MEGLKPCPFCGGKAVFEQFDNPKSWYVVRCTVCGCQTDGFRTNHSDATDAQNKLANAAVWNRRAAPENKPLICPLLSDAEVKQPCIEGPCPAILNEPLMMEQLKRMDGQRVWTQFRGLGMYGLVAYHSDPDGDDGDDVYITNNLGGRSTYEEILGQGGDIYPRKPEGSEP